MVLNDRKEIDERIYVYPTSAIKHKGKKINYADFLQENENQACLGALKNVGSKINFAQINSIIDTTPYLSDTHKLFLKTIMKERKAKIIDKTFRAEFFKAKHESCQFS